MSPRKPASQELTKEMIVKEARNQFIKKGYRHVSMREIAKQLKCSHGAIYYHYTNKAELFYAIIEADFSSLNEEIEKILLVKKKNRAKLKDLFLAFMAFGLNNQHQYELMFMMRDQEVDSLSAESANKCYAHFAQAVQTLVDKPLAIKDIWSAFMSLHGFVAHHRGYVSHFRDVEQAAEAHVSFIIKGLT
ncbi:TetR/AcrR family transcriptional regulator [Salipaludibacillus sp. LMS25]|jgi:AcrR family transcriptional regulator|uniref:TetR/AcrR family transcriptional regulator n=1 Tax=Salipaludibacillus sp. LMS25 TaxID=2924031 RepID=UPI0020D084C5|nr:TetR/AcrR family transcriptional regulator [Salipaludibacillus sp. LMS25]UTR13739.1 TetR/AcrR family transcriptional regulator [Salipaludibacillus sp. LMS25]